MDRRINAAGLSLIKNFESLRLNAYRDTGGVATIGWGHTRGVKMGQTITEAQASDFLMDDLEEAESAVSRFVAVSLNDNQFAALVSFAFNVGTEAFRRSTLRKKLNAGDYKAVPGQLALWVHDNGKKLNGLVRRRKAEADLWNTPFVAKPEVGISTTPAKPAPDVVGAQKTAGVPFPPKAPESAPTASSGGKTAIGFIVAVLLTALATATDAWQHLIAFVERIF